MTTDDLRTRAREAAEERATKILGYPATAESRVVFAFVTDWFTAGFLAHAAQQPTREQISDLAEWHETKAEKARRYRPEVNGENRVMDKAAEVHEDAARRLFSLLDGAGS